MKFKDTIINAYQLAIADQILDDSQKTNVLFDIVLEQIIKNKWIYAPDKGEYGVKQLLNSNQEKRFQVNCFDLSKLFIGLCKLIGVNDAHKHVYKHKPTSKVGQKLIEDNTESGYTFKCFDEQFEQLGDQICFDRHCVALVNGRFYDLVFSCAYKDVDAPYDDSPFAKAFSYMDSNRPKKALQVLQESKGMDLNQTFDGETLLHIATRNRMIPIVSFLLVEGADANQLSNLEPPEVALAYAPDVDSELFKLLSEKTDPLLVNNLKQKHFLNHFADAVELIMNGGDVDGLAKAIGSMDINFKGEGGWTLLHFAASTNNLTMAEYLLAKGADANIIEDLGCAPIQYVSQVDSPLYWLLYHKTDKSILDLIANDAGESIDEPELNSPEQNPKTPTPVYASIPTPGILNISMQVLGGFMAVVGCAAVATAFILLNASTFGTAGLLVAGLGVAYTLAGIGIFAAHTIPTPSYSLSNEEKGFAYSALS